MLVDLDIMVGMPSSNKLLRCTGETGAFARKHLFIKVSDGYPNLRGTGGDSRLCATRAREVVGGNREVSSTEPVPRSYGQSDARRNAMRSVSIPNI